MLQQQAAACGPPPRTKTLFLNTFSRLGAFFALLHCLGTQPPARVGASLFLPLKPFHG